MLNLLKLLTIAGPDSFIAPRHEKNHAKSGGGRETTHIDDNGNAFINVDDEEFQRVFARHIQALSRY
ncbi:hypothetical protein [Serratia sp. Je.1.23.a]|uniref:hypothetical protein n=1 Tax=Serratia sp. Je.1.23.a TaxID=3142841 RepID=UPI003DA8D131